MLRTSGLTTIMSSAICALVATSAIDGTAFAQIPGQKRVIYKISDINESDAERFCKDTYGENTSFRLDREKDVVICARRQFNPQLEVGTGGVSVTINGEQWTENTHHLNDLCGYKHKGYGTWVGDGGRSCYDSYWTW